MRSRLARLADATSLPTRPILHRTVPSRSFASTPTCHSHIGSAPIAVPAGVSLDIPTETSGASLLRGREEAKSTINIKGPLGQLSLAVPYFLTIKHDVASNKATVSVLDRKVRRQREMWGTTRAYLANYIMGVSEGHSCILRLVGVGYRATIENAAVTKSAEYEGQQFVSLKVGYSHPIELGVPKGVKASTPQPTRILLEGTDKEAIKSFAAKIRKWRVPEPYKGRKNLTIVQGIFVDQETIKLKSKKIR